MAELLIKNGYVFDPVLGIKGDKSDVAIKDGKIVDKVSSKAEKIDAKGMTVMAGGIDIHSHVVGPKVNSGRQLRPEDKLFKGEYRGGIVKQGSRMEMGFSVPTTFRTGYNYSRMGYSFVNEAAMPPIHAAHVHEEIRDTPIIDNAAMPVFGNNWFNIEYIKNGEIENSAAYTAWILQSTYGFGVKCVNPGGSEAWGWGENCADLNDPVPFFDITPAEIIKGLIETCEYLKLPHSLHLHGNNLGNPGNYEHTIETLRLAEGYKTDNKFGREQLLHNTHLQFYSYGGDSWANFESKAKEVMDYVNQQKNLTVDLGCVTLDETTTMTADGPFEHHLNQLNHLKWSNTDVELETAAGIVPYVYSPNIKVCGVQWAIGLELALYAKDLMRVHITTDHPNAGPFTRYPRVIKWLMSQKAREDTLNSLKWTDKVIDATTIAGIDRELDLYDIAMMTRAGTSKALGLSHIYGSLTPGLDANVAIYNLDADNMPSDPDEIEKAFLNTAYTIKTGEVVVKDGKIVNEVPKSTIWTNVIMPENKQLKRDLHNKFSHNYTVNFENYAVFEEHVHNPRAIEFEISA